MVGVDVSQANGQAKDMKIGTTGPLVLVGSGFGHCQRDRLAAPLHMFYHTTVRLHRNKFYLIYIFFIHAKNPVSEVDPYFRYLAEFLPWFSGTNIDSSGS